MSKGSHLQEVAYNLFYSKVRGGEIHEGEENNGEGRSVFRRRFMKVKTNVKAGSEPGTVGG
jgi:hypothetical protein